MAFSSLAQRVTTALVLVLVVLAALFLLPPRGWAIFSLALMALAAHEWAKLVGYRPQFALLFIGGVLLHGSYLLFADAMGFGRGWPAGVVLAVCSVATAFWILVAPAWLASQWSTRAWLPMALVGWIVLIGAWVAIVELQARSPWLVLAAMAVVWIADTAAYFTGRKFGRRKLAPSISPNKSWEGAWGGMAAVALYALLLIPFSADAGYSETLSSGTGLAFVLFVVLLGAVSIVGDLYESMLKRQAGVKDSGSLLPGHGGVLDRIDALLSAMPLAAVAATLFLPKAS
jgi:phosphatidate cytidylyltransferase